MSKKILLVFSVLLSLISCKYELLPEPSGESSNISSPSKNKKISAPVNLKASQGDYRAVTLTWDSVPEATQYLIYSADTEFDSFVKKGETKGSETTFTVPESTGSTKSYYVKSVDYYGNTSLPSFIVNGTTISVPIITDITKNDSGDVYTLNWWMSNCSESTYEDSITYIINCYEEGVNTPVKIEIPGTETSYNFTTLKASTTYKFTIEAYKQGTKQKHEVSDTEPIETGHRIVPDAVKDFTVSQGNSKDTITLKFKLPPAIESFDDTTATYIKDNPVYFTLKRKLSSEPETSYTTVYNYIGSKNDSSYKTGKYQVFGSYTVDSEITVTDTTLTEDNRGKKYDYLIQSYTDINTAGKNLTSPLTSIASSTGWLLAPVTFKAVDDITLNGNEITNIKVTFLGTLNQLDIPYTYVLTEKKYGINGAADGTETQILKSDSLQNINAFTKNFEESEIDESKGYYEYKLYVLPQTSDASPVLANAIEAIAAPSKITVIKDASALPEITYNGVQGFHVEEGYKDKFILQWDSLDTAEVTCKYVLSWKNKIGEGYSNSYSTVEFTESSYSDKKDPNTTISKNGTLVTLVHSAVSGEIRSYTLTATTGLTKSYTNTTDFETLGTAKPKMATPDYRTIRIEWDPVLHAKESNAYTVEAKYKSTATSLLNGSNCTLTEENGKVVCTITDPDGYNDATKSGKPIDFTVTTASKSQSDTTTGTEEVFTLGPANLSTYVDDEFYNDHINIFWNKTEGTTGYIIFRSIMNNSGVMENDGDILYVKDNDVYLVDEGSLNKLSSTFVSYDGNKVALSDKYEYCSKEDANQSIYKDHQRKLSWGIPYGYTVIPVLSEKDASFAINGSTITTSIIYNDASNNFNYTGLQQKKSSTFGYGLNVKASKATSSSKVTISWEKPYVTTNKVPKIYKRKDSASKWNVVPTREQINSNATSFDIPYEENDTSTYEYAVIYNDTPYESSAENAPLKTHIKAYVEALDETLDTVNSPTEKLNKGYTLSIPNGHVSAAHKEGFKEVFDWTDSIYDFNNRNVGPDCYEIQILNKNKISGWTTIATVPAGTDSNVSKKAEQTQTIKNSTNVNMTESSSFTATFEPVFEAESGTRTFGQMMVLRDYKHYYRLIAKKGDVISVADTLFDTNGDKIKVFAYRDIKDEELMYCVSLIIADAIHKSGISSGGNRTCNGSEGSFVFNHPSATNDITWGTNDSEYRHIFTGGTPYAPANSDSDSLNFIDSPFKIQMKNKKDGNATSGSGLYYLPKGELIINNYINNDSYGDGKTLTFTMGEKALLGVKTSYLVTITYNSKKLEVQTNSTTKQADYKKIFPFTIGSDRSAKQFYCNTNLDVYKSPWWESAQGGN